MVTHIHIHTKDAGNTPIRSAAEQVLSEAEKLVSSLKDGLSNSNGLNLQALVNAVNRADSVVQRCRGLKSAINAARDS